MHLNEIGGFVTRDVTRRTVTNAAWSVPIVAFAVATPAAAASDPTTNLEFEAIGPVEFDLVPGALFQMTIRTFDPSTGATIDGEPITFVALEVSSDGINFFQEVVISTGNDGTATAIARVPANSERGTLTYAAAFIRESGVLYTINII